jgi:FkbM family methyltransferase
MDPVGVRSGIVVDLGCFPHRDEISIEPLVHEYQPDLLYGFDPWPGLVEGEREYEGARVVLERKAAWIEDGEIEFARVRGFRAWNSTVVRAKGTRGEWSGAGDVIRVPCFDFSAWLSTLTEPAVVKMDVEGAEFEILERMVDDGTDLLVSELLVEWHDDRMPGFHERREQLTARLRCPIRVHGDYTITPWSTLVGIWRSRRAIGAR